MKECSGEWSYSGVLKECSGNFFLPHWVWMTRFDSILKWDWTYFLIKIYWCEIRPTISKVFQHQSQRNRQCLRWLAYLNRCPPILDIVLRVLSAYLQASRVFLHNHMLSNPILENAAQAERERHDLKSALIAAQESAIIQILLECCLPREDEQREVNTHKSTYL